MSRSVQFTLDVSVTSEAPDDPIVMADRLLDWLMENIDDEALPWVLSIDGLDPKP